MQRWLRRILKWLGFGLLGLVALVFLLLGFVAGTTPGGRMLIGQVAPRLPVAVSVSRFEGRLAGRFRLLDARVALDGVDVAVDTLEVHWRPGALMGRHLQVERVFAGGVDVTITPVGAAPETTAVVPDTATAIALDLPVRITLGALRAQRISVSVPGVRIEDAVVTASGSPDAYAATIAARVSGDDVPAAVVSVAADGGLNSARLGQLTVETLGGRVTARGSGTWSPQVAWDLDVQVRDLDPGLVIGDTTTWHGRVSTVLSTRGSITNAGPEAFVAIDSLDGHLREFHILGAGRLDVTQTGARIESLELAWGPLDVRIRGEASWSPEVAWSVDFSADSLHSALFLPDTTGLSGVVHLRGHTAGGFTDVLRASARVDSIDGEINGRAIAGHADVSVEDRVLTVSSLELFAGSNGLNLAGVLSEENIDVQLAVSVPDPSALLAGAHGSLTADVSARGPARRPDIKAVVSVDTLEYRDYAVRRVRVNAGVELGRGGGINADIAVDGVTAAGEFVDSVRVIASGRVEAHDLSVTVHADSLVSLALELSGGLFEDSWEGLLRRLDITEPHLGQWSLEDTVAVVAGATSASLSPLCLKRGDGARVCIGGYWKEADSSRAHLEVHEFPLAVVDSLLQESGHFAGALNALFDAEISASGDILASGRLSFDGAALQPADSTLATIHLDSMQVAVGIDHSGASARLRALVTESGEVRSDVTGALRIEGYNNVTLNPSALPLQAQLEARFENLAFIGAAVHTLEDVRGALAVSARAEGTIAEPELSGEFHLKNASARLPELGIHVRNINVEASGVAGEGFRVEGQATSGRGTVQLITETRRSDDGTAEAQIQLRGEHFRVVSTPEAIVDVSPDLTLDLANRRIDLKGDILVPFAKIEMIQLPENAVSPSRDVVFIDVEQEDRVPIAVTADVRLALGDSVSFRGPVAAGVTLDGRFGGSLRVLEKPNRPTVATGELQVTEGELTLFGQLLSVERGRAFFASGPVDNPGLDISASREFDVGRVKVGAHVRGTVNKPVITFFSTPAMSQANALSYLLTGRGIDDAGGSQNDVMMATAVTMGLQQGNSLTAGVGSSIGLDDARFESGETVEETSFVAGKYLGPSLYVSYGIGVFDRIGTWKMRYSLKRFHILGVPMDTTVQTETGRENGADLFWKFERGDPPARFVGPPTQQADPE